tara:strand:+ start:722 stop:1906 length:1185 start_codon:yes stop_codon:yes gene_type:complete
MSKLLNMKVPSPGESISEVELIEWLVSSGDYVEKDQSIAEVDSDKATLELPAEESGVINILVDEGETVNVGQVVCTIDTSVKKKEKKNVTISENNNNRIEDEKVTKLENEKKKNLTPLANSIANVENLSISDNDEKKIKKQDIIDNLSTISKGGDRGFESKKLSSLRKKISSRLVKVKNETAMLTTFNEVDMSSIMTLRSKYKEDFKEKFEVSLGFMSFFAKAVTKAANEFQHVNSLIDGDKIISYKYVDLGIAVSAPKGLMVPVLRNAEKMTFSQVELNIKRLAIKARENKLSIEEMQGGTFTITNGGVFGSMLSTPIINPPQSAILGMHNIVERPVVVDGEITIRPIMYVALSYDHRIIDGKESVGFLYNIKESLENPVEKLLNNNEKNLFS